MWLYIKLLRALLAKRNHALSAPVILLPFCFSLFAFRFSLSQCWIMVTEKIRWMHRWGSSSFLFKFARILRFRWFISNNVFLFGKRANLKLRNWDNFQFFCVAAGCSNLPCMSKANLPKHNIIGKEERRMVNILKTRCVLTAAVFRNQSLLHLSTKIDINVLYDQCIICLRPFDFPGKSIASIRKYTSSKCRHQQNIAQFTIGLGYISLARLSLRRHFGSQTGYFSFSS